MKTTIETRKKKFLAFCLSVLMVTSTAVAFASCTDDVVSDSSVSEESSSPEEEYVEADDGLDIKNGNFAKFNDNNGLNVIGTTFTGWTKSVNSTPAGSAVGSNAASGIIDTNNWKNLTSKTEGLDYAKLAADAANMTQEKWDAYTVRDKLAFYDAWKAIEANKNLKIEEEFKFYEKFNVTEKDFISGIDNPGTPTTTEAYGEANTKILMIHNQYDTKNQPIGTAQKFTSSSSVKVPAGTAAKVSVWVKTADLKTSTTTGTEQEAVKKGAYISINHSVGGTSLDAYQVKNIQADEWTQYSFYLRSPSFADSTFSVVLGLGQGGGTDRLEYVNGYAFFDDVKYTPISDAEFDTAMAGNSYVANFNSTKETKTIDVTETNDTTSFGMDFLSTQPVALNNVLNNSNLSIGATKTENNQDYNYNLNADKDVTKVTTYTEMAAEAANNNYLASVYNNYFKDSDFAKNNDILLLMSSNGVAYTAKSSTEITFNDGVRSEPYKYVAVSFYVKTSDLSGKSGASITLNDAFNKTQFVSLDTTTYTPVQIGNDDDAYDGWQKCFFFVSNDIEDETEKANASFTLDFSFGPLTINDTTTSDAFYEGFAAFTGLEIHYIDNETEFESATAGTYTKIVSLKGNAEDEETTGNSGFDSVATVPENAIETGFAALKNYKGVYSNSAYVSYDKSDLTTNQNENAGLLNQEHADNYGNILSALKTAGAGQTATWNGIFGSDVSQPLVIMKSKDNSNKNMSYGFIGNSTTVAANSYKAVSVRIKTNAEANVYLIDTDDMTNQNALSIKRNVSYWYDDEGNLCVKDPSSEDFKKRTDVAFKLQANGLYKWNTNCTWEGMPTLNANDYYANLNAYAKDPNNGNRVVAEGGASHDYSTIWDNEGVDGIAFYHKDGKYYADKETTIEVKDFSETKVPTRHDAADAQKLQYTVDGSQTATDWVTVTFYIHTGATAKNYRLEVWCGDRNDTETVVKDNAYVLVDTNNPGTADSNFASLIEEYKEIDGVKYFEDVFSYYDTNKFLRYNASLDENGYGNLYANGYTPSEYYDKSGVAYLEYKETNKYTAFADFSLADVTVAAESIPSDTEEEETEEEEDTTNVWLLASSIAVAAVLLLAIVSIIIRKSIEASRKKRGVRSHIDSASKPKKIKKEKAKKSEEESKDDSPYND